jgi:hypothetical protein
LATASRTTAAGMRKDGAIKVTNATATMAAAAMARRFKPVATGKGRTSDVA